MLKTINIYSCRITPLVRPLSMFNRFYMTLNALSINVFFCLTCVLKFSFLSNHIPNYFIYSDEYIIVSFGSRIDSLIILYKTTHTKNHTKTKKTPLTVWNAQNLHTLDSHIILKLSVSITKLSTLRGENPAYAALSEQKDSDKRKTVLPYKKFFHKIFA